jgi:hypothetical protein
MCVCNAKLKVLNKLVFCRIEDNKTILKPEIGKRCNLFQEWLVETKFTQRFNSIEIDIFYYNHLWSLQLSGSALFKTLEDRSK